MQNARSARISKEVTAIRHSLRSLDRSFRRLVPVLTMAVNGGRPTELTRSLPRLSAKARAALVLQGRYMGFMRQLKPRQKAQVRKLREVKGVRMAIVRARALKSR